MTKSWCLLIPLCALSWTAGCQGQHAAPDGRDIPHVAGAIEESPPTLDDAAHGTYWGGRARQVTLIDGRFTGPKGERVELLRQFYVVGDLEGDGAVDAVVVLAVTDAAEEPGHYLAVLRHLGTDTISLGTALLGHPVEVRSVRVEGRRILVDLVRGTDQAPSTVAYELGAGELVEVTTKAR